MHLMMTWMNQCLLELRWWIMMMNDSDICGHILFDKTLLDLPCFDSLTLNLKHFFSRRRKCRSII